MTRTSSAAAANDVKMAVAEGRESISMSRRRTVRIRVRSGETVAEDAGSRRSNTE